MPQVEHVVIECPQEKDRPFIERIIRKYKNVWVIQPFCAYHHKGAVSHFPQPIPEFVLRKINSGELKLIAASKLNSRSIMLTAPEQAVRAIESLFPAYFDDHAAIIRYVCRTLNSEKAVNIFKKSMCDVLGEFFSLNTLLHSLETVLGPERVLFVGNYNYRIYNYFLSKCSQKHYPVKSHPNVFFARSKYFFDSGRLAFKSFQIYSKLMVQVFASVLLAWRFKKRVSEKKKYKYAISVHAPGRQLRNNKRGPDFLIDDRQITREDTAYILYHELDEKQFGILRNLGSDIYALPKAGRFFSNTKEWLALLMNALKSNFLKNAVEVELGASALFNYFRWEALLKKISFDHYITHCDFSIAHISRNRILKQKGVTTWYFTDAVNFGHGFRESDEIWNRHPFWTYMDYDNLVTWYKDLADFFSKHPETFRSRHVVGCLWASHVGDTPCGLEMVENIIGEKLAKDLSIIAVYPSTYSVKGITSYDEGLQFLSDIIRLAEDLENIYIIIKEKKDIGFQGEFEPELGKRHRQLYESVKTKPRIKILTNQNDTSELMSYANICVSFPFTSTTTEALSAGKSAFWHDPDGHYRNTPYARQGGLVTHGYKELLQKVRGLTSRENLKKGERIEESTALDPFGDGRAIERFRQLLLTHDRKPNGK